ncbi:MAG: hypothetical protein JXR48_16110 [Candidatus Delongbacteria bacterium]|nr:hypothetical protein [Candidatus Delongbacteria bacterium]MBN2836483.1 hypothetical protein [Candidatus Delongbacteria bacterium]
MKVYSIVVLLGFFLFNAFGTESNFEIIVPGGWVKNEQSLALGQYQNGMASLIITKDSMPYDSKTPDSYVEFIKGRLAKSFSNTNFETVEKGTLDKLDTRELKYTAEISGMKFYYDVLYVFKDNKAFTITSGNLIDKVDEKYKNEIKSIFASFKLK